MVYKQNIVSPLGCTTSEMVVHCAVIWEPSLVIRKWDLRCGQQIRKRKLPALKFTIPKEEPNVKIICLVHSIFITNKGYVHCETGFLHLQYVNTSCTLVHNPCFTTSARNVIFILNSIQSCNFHQNSYGHHFTSLKLLIYNT